MRVPIQNTGLLDAPSVIVYLTPPNGVELDRTISVPAGSMGRCLRELDVQSRKPAI